MTVHLIHIFLSSYVYRILSHAASENRKRNDCKNIYGKNFGVKKAKEMDETAKRVAIITDIIHSPT